MFQKNKLPTAGATGRSPLRIPSKKGVFHSSVTVTEIQHHGLAHVHHALRSAYAVCERIKIFQKISCPPQGRPAGRPCGFPQKRGTSLFGSSPVTALRFTGVTEAEHSPPVNFSPDFAKLLLCFLKMILYLQCSTGLVSGMVKSVNCKADTVLDAAKMQRNKLPQRGMSNYFSEFTAISMLMHQQTVQRKELQ